VNGKVHRPKHQRVRHKKRQRKPETELENQDRKARQGFRAMVREVTSSTRPFDSTSGTASDAVDRLTTAGEVVNKLGQRRSITQ
jgi:hypothetical protein